jgi:hypothetical protein
MDTDYYKKYLKYKNKYFELKYELQTGNGSLTIPADNDGYTLIIFNHKDIDVDSVLFTGISAFCVESEFSKNKIDCSNNFRDIDDKLPKSYELFNSVLKMALWVKLNKDFHIIDKYPNIEKKGLKTKSQGTEIKEELKNNSVIDNNNLHIIKQLITDNLLQHGEKNLGRDTKSYDVLICKIAGLTGSNKLLKIRQITLPIS